MATISKRALEVAKTLSGNSAQTLAFPEAASQTFKKGAVLTLNASGYVAEAGANPPRILGVAAQDGKNNATDGLTDTLFWLPTDDTVFVGNLSGTNVSARTDRGRECALVLASGLWHIDNTGSRANCRAIIYDLDPRDAVGDTAARVHFVFFSQYRILNHTS